jgi:hypothetical protein
VNTCGYLTRHVATWRISGLRRDDCLAGSDLDAAYAINYAGPAEVEPQSLVEYVAGAGKVASERPPRRREALPQ